VQERHDGHNYSTYVFIQHMLLLSYPQLAAPTAKQGLYANLSVRYITRSVALDWNQVRGCLEAD